MIRKYQRFREEQINESGIQNIHKMLTDRKSQGFYDVEIWFHQDLDGVTSALAMKKYLEDYGMEVIDTHIIQYGGIEYAVRDKQPESLACLVDFAHGKGVFHIQTDHHSGQAGTELTPSTHFKATRSNVETISGVISPGNVFTSTDIELIQTVDSANFLKYDVKPEDIQNAIFQYKRDTNPSRNRFLMGFVVNRLLLSFKNKRISVTSLDGKRHHINKNLLECLVLDSTPSLYSMFNNLKHYIKSAVSLEWDRSKREQNVPKKLSTPQELTQSLMSYIETRKPGRTQDVKYDANYKIIYQYGIGNVFTTGSYDRYVVFKNYPEADFVCTVFPMGLIQVSCNPFKEKLFKDIDLGEIGKEVLAPFRKNFENFYISIKDIKKINESEIEKMRKKYGEEYEGIGFKFNDLKAFYKDSIVVLPNRHQGDMKTKEILNLDETDNEDVQLLEAWMDEPYETWPDDIKEELSWMKISLWKIIEANSGGHKSITNIQGLSYMACRKDLLKILFKTEVATDVMKLIGKNFIENLKSKIDLLKSGKKVNYEKSDIELKSSAIAESLNF